MFFQAEDGIRDLVRSRGLGDVYKRQVLSGLKQEGIKTYIEKAAVLFGNAQSRKKGMVYPVSYTHLTLQTSDLV